MRSTGWDGDGTADAVTLQPADSNNPLFTVVPPVERVRFHDLHLRRPGTGAGTGVGILARSTVTNPGVISELSIERVRITGFASHGIHIEGIASARVAGVAIDDCTITACGGAGLRLQRAVEIRLAGCLFDSRGGNGLHAIESELSAYECHLRNNALEEARFVRCPMVRLDAVRFLAIDTGAVKRGCVLEGCDAGIVGPFNVAASNAAGTEGIVVTAHDPGGGGALVHSGPIMILSGRFARIATLVRVDDGATASSCRSMTRPEMARSACRPEPIRACSEPPTWRATVRTS